MFQGREVHLVTLSQDYKPLFFCSFLLVVTRRHFNMALVEYYDLESAQTFVDYGLAHLVPKSFAEYRCVDPMRDTVLDFFRDPIPTPSGAEVVRRTGIRHIHVALETDGTGFGLMTRTVEVPFVFDPIIDTISWDLTGAQNAVRNRTT